MQQIMEKLEMTPESLLPYHDEQKSLNSSFFQADPEFDFERQQRNSVQHLSKRKTIKLSSQSDQLSIENQYSQPPLLPEEEEDEQRILAKMDKS